jgi:hypothetical protein
MSEVVHLAHPEEQPLLAAKVQEAAGAGVHRRPFGHEAGLLLGLPVQEGRASGSLGQQQPGFFERLAQGGHPVGQAAGVDAQQGAGLGIGPADAGGLGLRPAIERIHRSPREDEGPTHEVGVQVAPDHEHFERAALAVGLGGVADHHDRGGLPECRPVGGRYQSGD